mgnify:FL=1
MTARISGAPARSFAEVHLRASLIFAIVLATAYLGRAAALELGWPPIVTLIVSVALGVVALALATRILGRRLWGDFIYEQGAKLFGGYTPPANGDGDQRDDGRA